MTTQFITAATTAIAVSAAAPATHDAAGFAALTFTAISLASELGEFGPTDNLVTYTPLSDPTIQKAQGSRNYGSLPISAAYTTIADAGIAILETAHSSRANVSCKVTMPDGAIRYFQAACMGVREIVGGADAVLGLATTLEITTSVVKVAAPS
jgi:hypothetical protein